MYATYIKQIKIAVYKYSTISIRITGHCLSCHSSRASGGAMGMLKCS